MCDDGDGLTYCFRVGFCGIAELSSGEENVGTRYERLKSWRIEGISSTSWVCVETIGEKW